MSGVEITDLAAGYGHTPVLDLPSLSIRDGELLSVLGPSGCGKTTLLNCIAGFVQPTRGRVAVGGRDITDLPPYRRGLGMVFQSYALFPHLSVADNVAYGLRIRRRPRAERDGQVAESLRLVGLEGFAHRRPHQLSGGQQQRVAVARALATRPSVLLLDEPLSNLDARLRRELRGELRALQKRVGITTVFVTHDQEEALSLSDRVAVMNAGQIEQLGPPEVVYREPRTVFVAQFIGAANVLDGRAVGLPGVRGAAAALRPERIRVTPVADGQDPAGQRPDDGPDAQATDGGQAPAGALAGTVRDRAFGGDAWHLTVEVDGGTLVSVRVPDAGGDDPPAAGSAVRLTWEPDDVIVLDPPASS